MTPHYFRCHVATLLCSASFLCLSSAPGCYHERVYFCACWLPVKKWSVPHVPQDFLLAFSTGSTLYALSPTDVAANHKHMWVYILRGRRDPGDHQAPPPGLKLSLDEKWEDGW